MSPGGSISEQLLGARLWGQDPGWLSYQQPVLLSANHTVSVCVGSRSGQWKLIMALASRVVKLNLDNGKKRKGFFTSQCPGANAGGSEGTPEMLLKGWIQTSATGVVGPAQLQRSRLHWPCAKETQSGSFTVLSSPRRQSKQQELLFLTWF